MKVIDIIKGQKPSLSFEVFPPKQSQNYERIWSAAEQIAALSPSYMSVTYGAGGTGAGYTVELASGLKKKGVVPLAHLTCVGATKEKTRAVLTSLREAGIENILALRGDLPDQPVRLPMDYQHASDLVKEIEDFGGFCVGGACYPESHPESENCFADVRHLKKKVEAGCEFLTTQMFFDNNILYNFIYRLREAGVQVPVVAGIMPVTSASQIKRIIGISGNALPQRFIRIVDRYADQPEALKQAGIAYATEQIIDLFANGINAVHVYSMNKPEVAQRIQENVSAIIQ